MDHLTRGSEGADVDGYNIIFSLEFGYRGLSVDGDLKKYQSDLNYKLAHV